MPRPTPSKEPQIVDHINDSDDEEIDEDEAFNSEDELMYGSFLSGEGSSKNKKKNESKNLKSMNDNSDDDDDDGSDESEDDEDVSEGAEDSEESDDDNDWAGSSDDGQDDDGGQYMLDLLNKLDGDTDNSMNVKPPSKAGGGGGKISLNSAASEAAVRLPECEFYSGALSGMSNSNVIDDNFDDNNHNCSGNGNTSKLLTLDSLMGGIADTAGFASVQKSMRALSSTDPRDDNDKGLQTTRAPVSRVISDRASRKVHYQSTSEDVTLWKEAIHEQRDAETLDFRTNKGGATTNRITRDTLVDKFEATNVFEKELQRALEKAGMEDEQKMLKREKKRLTGEDEEDDDEDGQLGAGDNEEDDLGSNRISMEEYKKRHGELAKLRALMFYEEQKRHRINKIKSKKYRKIRKRQRERQQNAEEEARRLDGDENGALERERQEQEEMDRMRERMTLAHKNTSKWARRMLRRGSKMDVEERRALSLQIAKGEELRRKMMGEDDEHGKDGESGSENGETEKDLLEKARDILMEDDDDFNDEGENGKTKTKKKGLLNMEFMKRGMEAQRARARDEARKLLEELEANEMAAMSSNSEDENNDKQTISLAKKKQPRVATEAEINNILPEGTMVATSLKFGKADGFSIKVDGDIELRNGNNSGDDSLDKAESKRVESNQRKKTRTQRKQGGINESNADAPQSANRSAIEKNVEEENPWIMSKSTQKSSKPLSRVVNIDKAVSMLVDDKQDRKSAKRKRDDDEAIQTESREEETANKEVGIANLSQAELVRRAFAAPSDLEAEEEFMKEKERMKERDDPTRKKKEDTFVTGWGSWAGAGTFAPKKPGDLPSRLNAPISKNQDQQNAQSVRKDDGMSTVIINEKRLKKTAKFQLAEIPYPYRSRVEYEKAIAGNIGQEWNTIHGTKEMSRPSLLVRAGKIIQPIGTTAKKKVRAPAKF